MLFNIQALRWSAAIFVVFVHVADARGASALPSIGRGGVDLFFVISGFIMVHATRKRLVGPLSFIGQRIARIVPTYWLLTLCLFILTFIMPDLLKSTKASVTDLVRSLLFIPYEKANGLMQPFLFVGWTLNYEMFFYALFALGLLLPRRFLGLGLTTALLLACAATGWIATAPEHPLIRFYGAPVLLEFVAGMTLGILVDASVAKPLSRPGALSLLAVALVAATVLLFGPAWWRCPTVILCGGGAAVIVFAALRLEQAGWRMTSPLSLLLGNASYAIYLTHPFMLEIVRHAARFGPSGLQGEVLVLVLSLASVAAAGIAFHVWIEKPLSRWIFVCAQRPNRWFGNLPETSQV